MTQDDLRFYQDLLRAYIDSANDAIFVLCDEMKFLVCNRLTETWFGASEAALTAHNRRVPITALVGTPESTAVFRENFEQVLKNGTPRRFECQVSPQHGDQRWLEFNISRVDIDDAPMVIAVARDISEQVQARAQLDYLAYHDALTGLPNRTLLRDRLVHALAQAHRDERLVALLFLDLDRFKSINDTLGHAVGDTLLQAVTGRLRDCVREGDTIARLGGDEFTVILEGAQHVDDVAQVAQKILSAFFEPFRVERHEIFMTTSIGVTIYPFDEEDPDNLLKNADIAMYRAKEMGGKSYQFYTADMTKRVVERMRMENRLRHALERDEFVLHYQPLFHLGSGRIVGMEALLRWQPPETELVYPDAFIPALEDTGLIVPVGNWVLKAACAQLETWNRGRNEPLRIAINISPRQLGEPAFLSTVEEIVTASGLAPGLLEFEITESALLQNTDTVVGTLNRLRKLGIRLAMDDFGTGYSSLSHLRHFQIDILKIDRSFVRDLTSDPDAAAIVAAIVALGNALKLTVVAEGVETEQQLAALRGYACNLVQGYLFSRPVPAAQMEALLCMQ